MQLNIALSLTSAAILNKGAGLVPPPGYQFVTRVRDGEIQYAASPSRNDAYAVHRSA